MNRDRTFIQDDDDDTILFEKMREYVIENYPNPKRVGCLNHETLKAFVESPGSLDLSDPKYLHIVKCAECTRELNEFRSQWEQRVHSREPALRKAWFAWSTVAVAAAVCLVTVMFVVRARDRFKDRPADKRMEAAVQQFVDLNQNGITRGIGQADPKPSISLSRRIIELDLLLPFYSPSGDYRVTLSKGCGEGILRSQLISAVSHGPRTELHTTLDLRDVKPGIYYLGTIHDGDGAYYYPVRLD